jgi:predicted nucleotidyltransferase
MEPNIKDWLTTDVVDLRRFITSQLNIPYVDVTIHGSYVFGTATEKSDIDVVIWTTEPQSQVYRPILIPNNTWRDIHISVVSRMNVDDKTKYRTWNLPYYSLLRQLFVSASDTNEFIDHKTKVRGK